MELKRSINCREIRKCDVVGSDGEKVGRIGDMTFKFDRELKLSQFILSGPIFEEFLEAIKIRPDKDPVFDASMIERIGDKILLSTNKNSLKTTLDKGAIPDDEIRLSKLERLLIVDKDGDSVGKAVDVDFEVDGSAYLIVGGGFFEEKLEALGLKSDVDIIVPGRVIENIGEKIKLTVDKADLALTMDEAVKSESARAASEAVATHREISKIRLYAHRPI